MTRNKETMMANASLLRREILSKIFDERRDIDDECGYPKDITSEQYRYLYDREGIAKRVIAVYPEECWALDPEIYETEEANETEFEKVWNELQEEQHLYHYFQRADELSGVGRYGIILLGIDDGLELSMPVEGINERGEKVGNAQGKVIYIRTFDEEVISIKSRETDTTNPRYGYPTMYSIVFESYVGLGGGLNTKDVHWTRIIHVADGRKTSEIYGTPRLQSVYNRIYDLRKILSGSGEMFWKGAFPGFAFEVNPDISDVELDTDTLREEFAAYSDGLQRYMALNGMTVKALAPQVADPTGHVENQLKAIAITLSIPNRILYGSEQAKLASTQDSRNWNKRLAKRQSKYLTPMLIRPFVDRLIAFGALPEPKEYTVFWPDLNTVTDEEKVAVAEIKTKALAQYIKGGVDQMIPPQEYLTMIMDMNPDEVEVILKAAEEYTVEEPEEEPEPEPLPFEDE